MQEHLGAAEGRARVFVPGGTGGHCDGRRRVECKRFSGGARHPEDFEVRKMDLGFLRGAGENLEDLDHDVARDDRLDELHELRCIVVGQQNVGEPKLGVDAYALGAGVGFELDCGAKQTQRVNLGGRREVHPQRASFFPTGDAGPRCVEVVVAEQSRGSL